MAATVSSAFRTKDEVTPTLRKMRVEAAKTDIAFESLGKTIDNSVGRRRQRTVSDMQRSVKGLGRETEETAAKTKASTRSIGDSISGMERDANPRLTRLRMALRKVELDPVKFAGQARIIKAEIRGLETEAARANLGKDFRDWDLAAGDLSKTLGRGGSGSGGGDGGLTARLGAFSGGLGLMGTAMIALLPIAVSLTGALSALVGSLGAATAGAGVLGAGVFGAAAVGIAGIVSVAKPAITTIKNAKTAQDAYNKAVSTYGDKSKQAILAQKNLDNAFKNHPGLRSFMGDLQIISSRWTKLTAPGQNALMGTLSDATSSLRHNEPMFASSANQSTAALRKAIQPLFQLMDGPQFKSFIHTMTNTFSRSIVPFGEGMRNIATAFTRIADAASPYVVQMFQSFDRMTGNFSKSTANTARTADIVHGLISQTTSWFHLAGAFFRLGKDFFGAGAKQGQGIVDSMTKQLNVWDTWVKRNPAKIQDFFKRSIDATGKLVKALGQIAKVLGQVGTALMPVLNMFTGLVGGAGKLGILGPLAAFAGIKMLGGGGAAAAGAESGGLGALLGGGAGLTAGKIAGGLATKIALPLVAVTAGYGAATVQGSAAERTQGALSALTFGLIHKPTTRVDARNKGDQAAQDLINAHGNVNQRVSQLTRQLSAGGQRSNVAISAGRGGGVTGAAGTHFGFDVTGKDRDRLKAELDYLKQVQKVQAEQKKLLDNEKALQRHSASQTHGAQIGQSLAHRFTTQSKTSGVTGAFQSVTGTFFDRLSQAGPAGAKTLAQTYVKWAEALKKKHPELTGEVDKLVKDVGARLNKLPGDAGIVGDKVYTSLSNAYSKVSGSMKTETERWRETSQKALTDIQKQLVSVLNAMGFSGSDATRLVLEMEHGGKAGSIARSTAQNANVFAKDKSGHPITGSNIPRNRKATGGRVPGQGLLDSVWVTPNTLAAPGELIVNRHTERDHDRDARQAGLPTLGDRVANTRRPHSQSMATGGRIATPKVTGSGAGPVILSGGFDIASFAANSIFNQLGAGTSTAGGVAGATAGLSGGTSGANQKLGRAMMLAAGFGADQWPALKALWTRESGWSATARNPTSGAFGIPQALPPGKMGAAAVAGDPRAQIGWGLNYIGGRYGNPAGAWAHEQQVGWYGKGGSFTARSPRVIGVGDKPEHVEITPLSKGARRGGVQIGTLIGHLEIKYQGKGSIEQAVMDELEKVAKKAGGMVEDWSQLA